MLTASIARLHKVQAEKLMKIRSRRRAHRCPGEELFEFFVASRHAKVVPQSRRSAHQEHGVISRCGRADEQAE